jgi:hypothetical protein
MFFSSIYMCPVMRIIHIYIPDRHIPTYIYTHREKIKVKPRRH